MNKRGDGPLWDTEDKFCPRKEQEIESAATELKVRTLTDGWQRRRVPLSGLLGGLRPSDYSLTGAFHPRRRRNL